MEIIAIILLFSLFFIAFHLRKALITMHEISTIKREMRKEMVKLELDKIFFHPDSLPETGCEKYTVDAFWEIKKALCKGCMVSFNTKKFDEENKYTKTHVPYL